MMKKALRLLLSINPFSITLGLIILVCIVFLIGPSFLELLELKTMDLRFISRGVRAPGGTVVLAVIDEKSLDAEGKWPWPRSKIAELIDYLSEDGAKVIGFDIGFWEPDQNSNLAFIQQLESKIGGLRLKNKALNRFLEESRLLADNDLILANAIKRSKAKVVLGYFFHMSPEDLGYQMDEETVSDRISQIGKSRYPVQFFHRGTDIEPFYEAYVPESNLPILNEAADSSGYFTIIPDPDGVVRWSPLVMKCGEEIFAPISIMCIWHYLDGPQLIARVAPYGIEGVQLGTINIPTNETGQMMINYLGPPQTFTHYPVTDIINNKYPIGEFKGKIVLVGATAVGMYDIRNTPFSPVYPGPEVHATVIDNILRGQFLDRPEWTKIFDLMAIILVGIFMGFVVPRLSAVKGIFFAIGLFIAYIFLARYLFVSHGLWFNMIYPLAALVILYISLTIYRYLTEERERRKIKGAFTYYVSSSVVNEMLKHPEKLKLGGDRKELSILFSDIRGFTTIAEGMSPEELVHLLNEYLTVMTDIVFKYDGTLDKYMGDAIMAIYGAPLDLPDHPSRACRSALEMMRELKKLNEKWVAEGKKPMDIGIGINTGPMMVGNMGSEQRFDFTVMGDSVNLGSRLEGANKSYKTNVIISEYTYERVKDEFLCMELDSVRVKGKKEPVKIYNLAGLKDLPEVQHQTITRFNQGISLYRAQKWDDAIQVFENITAMDPNLYAAQVYIQRCHKLKKNPPPPEWDGVYVMTTK
ncbi:MAG: adenylate/guanylate cyclase domain-containing protein [Deltaproteobacteria bacterium]|nr:adenylate/guanylate cyclase domain-containing protein [Deltaproteobacteria bacterium]RLB28414.1 MAG: adenylate/guanylate cyclase domain-containing protein [Deltaproteobacteria bacterium]